jgi:hypothetical protein
VSTRPCTCDGPHCSRCRLFHESPYHNKLWGGSGADWPASPARDPTPAPSLKASHAPLPCGFREGLVPVREAQKLGLPFWWRSYFPCGHPERPNPALLVIGGVAYSCPCQGCGPTCRGYTPDVPLSVDHAPPS